MNLRRRSIGILILSWAAVLVWMAIIYSLSAQPAHQSNKLSKGVTKAIVETIEKMTPKKELDLNKLNHLIRKNTHFLAYFVLGMLVMNAIRWFRLSDIKGFGIAWATCVLYAISDEMHQLFVPGRGGQVSDVLIDSAGALTGIVLFMFISKILGRVVLNKSM